MFPCSLGSISLLSRDHINDLMTESTPGSLQYIPQSLECRECQRNSLKQTLDSVIITIKRHMYIATLTQECRANPIRNPAVSVPCLTMPYSKDLRCIHQVRHIDSIHKSRANVLYILPAPGNYFLVVWKVSHYSHYHITDLMTESYSWFPSVYPTVSYGRSN